MLQSTRMLNPVPSSSGLRGKCLKGTLLDPRPCYEYNENKLNEKCSKKIIAKYSRSMPKALTKLLRNPPGEAIKLLLKYPETSLYK